MSNDEFFEQNLYGSSVFKDEPTLFGDYVPPNLPGREDELLRLARDFKLVFCNMPRTFSVNVALIGGSGVGKTACAKSFARRFPTLAAKSDVKIKFAYYNCYNYRSKSAILRNLLETECNWFTGRGFSDDELLTNLTRAFEHQDEHLIIILDEAGNLRAINLLEFLHAAEALEFGRARLSFILIFRTNELKLMVELQESGRINDTIELKGYSREELRDILRYRAELAFCEGAMSPDVLNLVTEIAGTTQSARYGIGILHQAGKIADDKNVAKLDPDMIRIAKSHVYPESRPDVLEKLKSHELLTALAITRILKKPQTIMVTIDDVSSMYHAICKERGIDPRSKITLYRQIEVLNRTGIVNKVVTAKGSGKRSRWTRISLHDLPAAVLEAKIEELLRENYEPFKNKKISKDIKELLQNIEK